MGRATQPNVIVFFTDQQRWDCSGLHGNPLELMPNFDRMAREGTHVAQSFTCQPVCGPARSCLQTGLYATRTGCWRNDIPLAPDARTLAHHFNDAGYHTGYIGKWHLASTENNVFGPVPEKARGGYREWLASNILEFTSQAYDTNLFDGAGQKVHLPGYRVDAVTDAAIRFIDRNQAKPFFLFTSYIEPHHQNSSDSYPAPAGYAERYRGRWVPPDLAALGGSTHRHLAGYFGMVKRLDEALGRLRDSLKSLDLEENTIVLFTSDHGCHFKTRNDEYKRSCHDSSIRVPTAFTGPGFTGGGHLRQLVSLVDLPPTLLDAAGLSVPADMQGRSLLPLLRGAAQDWPEEVFVQISESQVGRAIRTDKWKYSVVAPDQDGGKVSAAARYEEAFLYDLENDPYELQNLIGRPAYRENARQLRERLLRRMREAGEAIPEIADAPAARRA
jgi:arylsulfatase A-like enzyme